MNNPFSRLKHYLPSDIDPQENHATECLAACLVFSSQIRNAFIRFFLGEEFQMPNVADIVTQLPIKGGYIDLLTLHTGKFILAIEVKVKSPEDCNHHRKQLQDYRRWLDEQNEPDKYLFTLVRNVDTRFHPRQYGANGRRTWWALHKHFQKMLKAVELSEVEGMLVKNLCEYLENEAIVSTYETKDLLSYGAGVKARKAVSSIFNQIASRLASDGFGTSSTEDRKDYWPQLRIQHPRWNQIFGRGQNEKISLWFCVPGIWEATKHAFYADIEIWHELHGNDWQFAKRKLSHWLASLHSMNFTWDVYERGWNSSRENLTANEIRTQPKRIVAFRDRDIVELDQSRLENEDDLINTLLDLVKQYAGIVDSLGL